MYLSPFVLLMRLMFCSHHGAHVHPGRSGPGVPKKLTAFVDTTQPPLLTPGRWPETAGRASDPSRFRGPRKATMGYKGIITDYLPRNTTVIKRFVSSTSSARCSTCHHPCRHQARRCRCHPARPPAALSVMQGSEIGATQGFEYDFASQ